MEIPEFGEVRRIFGSDVLGPEEITLALGSDPLANIGPEDRKRVERIPFDRETLTRAADDGRMLVLRVGRDAAGDPLTIVSLARRFESASATRLEKTLQEAWFAREPFANVDTCAGGWALVEKRPLDETRNLSYPEQTQVLGERSRRTGLALRRRTAVEAVYDTLLFAAARQERLLESAWDWSSSPTVDGGWVTVGEFGPDGLKLLGYSKAVRFGTLGICANSDAPGDPDR
jgi:hypothetical protein